MTTATTTRPEKRLEGGWFQRLAWAALAWFSFGLLVWVPFLYVAIRRGRSSDWGAFASFALYEVLTLPWALITSGGEGDPFLGITVIVTLLMATWMLLFALFDRRTPPVPYGMPPGPHAQPPYQQQGYPYGR
ncbi:hypothetical protein [Streptomyces aurantiogriseus]|uniref:Uncharacterized protein n=1 Tax=Streptomyces aurantiogriseus TaxID=66870 RepID=A0A918C3B9_9ACTN|nr:hypothetical protein [Streptomyces aurantiogriseus]GGR04551.1 hypothetical protein GCM10010251_20170 [Streptomyces aurantiogriseus]